MRKTLLIGTVAALAVVAAPLVVAAGPSENFPGRDSEMWRPARYDQKHVVPGPHIPTPPKDPDAARGASTSGLDQPSAHDGAVGFSGGRAEKRTVREVERDSVRQTIRRLG